MKTWFAAVLAVALLPIGSSTTSLAGTKEDKQARFTEKVRRGIVKLGTGPEARVKLTLRDETELAGFVSQASESSLVVTDANGVETSVQYPDIAQVQGNNLRTRWKIVIGAAIVAGIIITLYIVRGAFCDGC